MEAEKRSGVCVCVCVCRHMFARAKEWSPSENNRGLSSGFDQPD